MFYDQLHQRLDKSNIGIYAKRMNMTEQLFAHKLQRESFTIDEVLRLICIMRSISLIEYVMGEMHPPWKEQHPSSLN